MDSKDDSEKPCYSIAVLGGGGVGKSALTIRFVTDNFVTEYDPTLEAKYKKSVFVEGKECLLDILDTAGQDEYLQMLDQWIRECSGYVLVYAIDDDASFTKLNRIREKILRVRDGMRTQGPIVVVGNKCDMEDRRKVTREQGQALADSWGARFLEASAKTKVNLEEIFLAAAVGVRDAAKIAPPSREESRRPCCSIM